MQSRKSPVLPAPPVQPVPSNSSQVNASLTLLDCDITAPKLFGDFTSIGGLGGAMAWPPGAPGVPAAPPDYTSGTVQVVGGQPFAAGASFSVNSSRIHSSCSVIQAIPIISQARRAGLGAMRLQLCATWRTAAGH